MALLSYTSPSFLEQAIWKQGPCRWLHGGKSCQMQRLDTQQPSCCAAFGDSSPSLAQITHWQLSIIQTILAPPSMPHLEEPSLGIGAETALLFHLYYYYLQSFLESIICQMER